MKISCSVICDLLPLYLENMLSDDSRAMVEEHIKTCRECADRLDEMRASSEVPVDTDASPLRKIKSTLRRKKIQAVLISVMLSIVLTVTIIALLTAPEFIPYSAGGVTVKGVGDGLVLAQFDDSVYGYSIDSYRPEESTGYVYHITAWNSIWNRKIRKSDAKPIILNPNGENVVSVYYCQADGNEDILIYGKDINPDGGIVTLPRLFLSYYALIAAGLAVICGLVMLLCRRNKKVLHFALEVFFLPVSYLLSHLIVRGFSSSSYTAARDLYAILLITIPLYIAFLIVIDSIRQHKAKEQEP